MKIQLLKKLSAFIITAMLFSASANAQIIYTDVNPDSTSTGSYNLDLNNDGTNDFVITYVSTSLNCNGPKANTIVRVSPLGTNEVVCVSGNYATMMAFNANINDTVLTWNNSANLYMARRIYNLACRSVTSGQWISANGAEGYLGLKLISGSNIYYGWARMFVTMFVTSFTIRDYAYNSTPNQPILAGQTVATGINENSFAESINIFPNPATNHVTIDLPKANEKVDITIADITGKIIYTTTESKMQKIEVNTEDFAKGIYMVQILREESFGQSGGFVATKKLVIEK